MTESLQSMTARADALKARGNYQDALLIYRLAVESWPQSAVAVHNLASILGDLGHHEESASTASRAIKMGLKAPETHLVLARALTHSGKTGPAQSAYRDAINLRSDMAPALFELSQLIWMSTANKVLALQPLVDAVRANPMSGPLHFSLSQALAFTGDRKAAAQVLLDLASRGGADASLIAQAADLLIEIDALDMARELAMQAYQSDKVSLGVLLTLLRAAIASGDRVGAAAAAAEACVRSPLNQHVLALQATVWRMLDDPRFDVLYDYKNVVRSYLIEPPAGWSSRADYLKDLAAELKAAHQYRTHPFGHSVREGSQLPNLLTVQTPAMQAFRQALAAPVQQHIDHLSSIGNQPLPLVGRNTGRWQIQGIWSVLLRPGGFHVDHVHPEGWLSSAFYVELPQAVEDENHEGWIRFGEAGAVVQPHQPAQHFVKPEPGMLVLFPSYMWHGTVPFTGTQSRLTVALDIIPV
ncbi:MAG: putative 2OG-Fe(II) oxygenase [Pseudohongiella sp.]|nr:putative 2OG-Fe(II) oxygenase [Pseudohongiella sp.]